MNETRVTSEPLYLGIDFGGTNIDIAVGANGTSVVESCRLPTLSFKGGYQAVVRALDVAAGLAQRHPITAIGLSSMGITREEGVLMAPNVPGWDSLRLFDMTQSVFPNLPVRIGNDVKAAALAECLWGELAGAEHGLYVNLGTGIALALICHGEVYQGAHGAAGEIAYYWRKAGEPGYAKNHAPLEELCGGGALDRRLTDRSSRYRTFPELIEAVRKGDDAARRVLGELVEPLIWSLSLVLITVDVELVVVGGGMAAAGDVLFPLCEQYWGQYVPFCPRLKVSRFGASPGIPGALALAAGG